jgi:hypothetical protein
LTFSPTTAGAPAYPNIIAGGANPTPPDVVVFEDGLQNPMVHEYDLIFEQKIADNTSVSVSYVGSAGRHLPLFVDRNLAAPSGTITYAVVGGGPLTAPTVTVPVFTGPRPNPAFGRITTISGLVDSTYNGLVFQVNRRLSRGLQVQASYTEARATDNGQTSQTFTSANNVLNPFDLDDEDATSNFQVKHRFVANAIWSPTVGAEGSTVRALLGGFTVAPAFQITSGLPYSANVTGNSPVVGRTSLGILGAGGTAPAGIRVPTLDRNAFQLPKTANLDLRVSRGFALGGEHRIEAMIDIFNVFNRLNYTAINQTAYNVGGTAAAPTLTYNTAFATLTNANANYFVFTPRQIQLAFRYTF